MKDEQVRGCCHVFVLTSSQRSSMSDSQMLLQVSTVKNALAQPAVKGIAPSSRIIYEFHTQSIRHGFTRGAEFVPATRPHKIAPAFPTTSAVCLLAILRQRYICNTGRRWSWLLRVQNGAAVICQCKGSGHLVSLASGCLKSWMDLVPGHTDYSPRINLIC